MDSVGFWSPVLEDSSLDALLEPFRAVLGSRLGRLEAILGRLASWAVLNRSWAILAVLVACLGQVAVILDSYGFLGGRQGHVSAPTGFREEDAAHAAQREDRGWP